MVLVQNWPFFEFFFRQYRPGKCLLRYSRTKNAFLGYLKKKFKSQKIDIFPKGLTHGYGLKMPIFPTFFFKAIQARKICFTIFQNEKTPLQGIKTKRSKSPKIVISQQGITLGFGRKKAIFPSFFLRQYRPGKCLLRYSRREKMPFWAIKKRRSRSPKIDIFPKGLTHGFGPKMAIFLTFLLRQYRAGKCLLRYSRTKKRLLEL